jgi:RHS repeat-associated protein
MSYDPRNSLLSQQDPLGAFTSYSYDPAQNQTLRTDDRGQVTSYSHDPLNRNVGYIYNSGSRATFTFDPAGRQTVMADWTGVTNYSYDADRRLKAVAYPSGKTLTYAYDHNSNRTTLLDSDGGLTTYLYDVQSRLTTISNPFAELTTITYDPLDRESRRTLANGVVTSHTFDPAGRETVRTQVTPTGSGLTAYTATYDAADNRQSVAEIDGNRVTYSYDQSNQLLSEQRSGPVAVSTTYTYDGLGNRLTMTNPGSITTYSYNAANGLTLIAPSIGAATTITFDANGNTILENAGGSLTTYTWDGENRLISRADPTNGILTSTYDATGQRSQLVTPSATTIFVPDGQNILIESNASGVTQAHYTDNPGYWGGKASQRRSGASSFYGFDLSSNTRLLTNAAAAILDTYLTDAFGLEKSITGTTVNPFIFDGEDGLYRDLPNWMQARARFLDAVLGRWPNRDPAGFDGNAYKYVDNNPVNYVDPTGNGPVPNTHGTGRQPPGSPCDNANKAMHKVCDSGWKCNQNTNCGVVDANIAAGSLCHNLRQVSDTLCGNYTDRGHQIQRDDVQAGIKNCQNRKAWCEQQKRRASSSAPSKCSAVNRVNILTGITIIGTTILDILTCIEDPAACAGLQEPIEPVGPLLPGQPVPIT